MKTLSLIFSFALTSSFCFSQNNRFESLKHALATATQDTVRVYKMIDLIWFYRYNNPDSALYYSQKAIELAHKIGSKDGEIKATGFTALVWQGMGNLPKSLEAGFKSLNIAEDNHIETETKAIPLGNIAYAYFDLEDYPKAMFYFKKMKQLSDNLRGSSAAAAFANMGIGIVYEKTNQLDSALYYLQQGIHYFKKSTMNTDPHCYRSLGDTYFKLGNHPLALFYYKESLKMAVINEDYRSSSLSNSLIAQFYKNTNKPDSSIYYAKIGLAEGEKGNQKVGILEAATLLSELYERKDTKEAFRYFKIATAAKEGLFGSGNMKAIQAMVAQEEERRNAIEAERVAHQNQLKQYLLFGGLALLLLIAFFLYRNNLQKQKANAVLQGKNDEINLQKDKVEKALTELKATQTQLIQSEKLASLGELTAGIAHEIQNPLNFVNNFSELSVDLTKELKEEIGKVEIPEKDKDYIGEILTDLSQNQEKINHHGKRASSIVKGMLEHSRASSGVKEPTDINKLADEYLRLSYHGMRAKDKEFNADYELIIDENLPKIEVIPQDIGRVLLNLINNAFYAVNQRKLLSNDESYTPSVSVTTHYSAPPLGAGGASIIIKVKDNGIGMSEATKAKIFQPFFTTKPTGQGTGLGLSLAYDIVTKGHGGTLEVFSTVTPARDGAEGDKGVGSEFILKLPF